MIDWATITKIGVSHAGTIGQERNVTLANRVSVIVFLLSLLLFASYAALYPWNLITTAILVVGHAALGTILFNFFGLAGLGRLWLCVLLPLSCLFVSIISKFTVVPVQDSEYYEFRFIMVASGIIPCILFRLSESKMLYTAIGFHFLAVALYDPLHNLSGAGYYQTGQVDGTYYFANVIVIFTLALLITSILSVKKESESSEEKNRELIRDLEQRSARNETQKEQIMQQSEILASNQQKLSEAYQVIERQKELLFRENRNLADEMVNMNKELTQTNAELIKSNNELRQFSFTVSHNLRGPVASLLGLVNLLDMDNARDSNREIVTYIRESAHQLDSIMDDLRKITDIRHDVFNVRQRIAISEELDQVMYLFKDRLAEHNIRLETAIDCAAVFSVRPFVHNILHNLISNSIKYRSDERQSVIRIGISENNNYYIISVADNGLGIDLKKHKDSLFHLYRRFHLHNDGRGLGLYLVKLQAESLGGFVDVESEVNKFTRFTVYLRKPANLNRQVLYSKEHALIFYDAWINSMGVIWRGPVSGLQYRDTFVKCLEFLNAYGTPNWISDLSQQGPVAKEDQEWMFREIMPVAAENGLTTLIVIRGQKQDDHVKEYIDAIKGCAIELGRKMHSFTNFEEARSWIQVENEKSTDTILNDGTPA